MKNRFIVLGILFLVPLLVGFWLGYRVGAEQDQSSLVEFKADELPIPQPVAYRPSDSRDSLTDEISNSRQNAITRSVAKANPTVVGINVTEVREYRYRDPFSQFFGDDPFFQHYFGGRTYRQEVKGLGSGFLISADGYILTNDHVAGNATKIVITLTNGDKYDAQLVGSDLVSDIALLKIDGKNLPYLPLGNSDDVVIGEWVIALGNPFGLFDVAAKPTVTVGVISATGMNLNAQGGRYYRNMIQTDAAINSGNSGGPLLNSLGEVIGINSVIYTPNQGNIGLGFAIPINRVKGIVAELKESGKIERNFWTGLEVQTVDRRIARYFGLDRIEGVIVSDVQRGSPADRSGFRPGDIIVEVNGERIASEESLTAILVNANLGDVLTVKVMREKKYTTLDLRIERRPS